MVMKKVKDNTSNVRDGPHQDGTWQYGPNAGLCQSTILTLADVSHADDEFVLGSTTYQVKATATPAAAGKVKVELAAGEVLAGSVTHICEAINANDPYFTATATGVAGEILIKAKAPGLSGKIGTIAITDVTADGDTVVIGQNTYEVRSTGAYGAGNIHVPVTALTKLVVAAALTAAINANDAYVFATNASSTDGKIVIGARVPYLRYGSTAGSGVNYPVVPYLELSETLTNGTITADDGHIAISQTLTHGVFSPSTALTVGGVPAVAGKVAYIKRAITAEDVTQTYVYLPMDFCVSGWIVQVYTSAGKLTQKGDFTIFDGLVTSIPGIGGGLKITKGTNHPFAATDVMMVIAWE